MQNNFIYYFLTTCVSHFINFLQELAHDLSPKIPLNEYRRNKLSRLAENLRKNQNGYDDDVEELEDEYML